MWLGALINDTRFYGKARLISECNLSQSSVLFFINKNYSVLQFYCAVNVPIYQDQHTLYLNPCPACSPLSSPFLF